MDENKIVENGTLLAGESETNFKYNEEGEEFITDVINNDLFKYEGKYFECTYEDETFITNDNEERYISFLTEPQELSTVDANKYIENILKSESHTKDFGKEGYSQYNFTVTEEGQKELKNERDKSENEKKVKVIDGREM